MSLSRQNGHSNTHSSSGNLRVGNTKEEGLIEGVSSRMEKCLRGFEVVVLFLCFYLLQLRDNHTLRRRGCTATEGSRNMNSGQLLELQPAPRAQEQLLSRPNRSQDSCLPYRFSPKQAPWWPTGTLSTTTRASTTSTTLTL